MNKRALTICAIGDARSVHVQNRTRCFAERGHKVYLITQYPAGSEGIEEIVIGGGIPPLLTNVAMTLRYLKAIRDCEPDLIHIHFAYNLGGWAAAATGFHPLIVSTMGSDIDFSQREGRTRLGNELTLSMFNRADLITVKSTAMAQEVSRLGHYQHKLAQISWGIDPNSFYKRDTSTLRAKLGLSQHTRVIFSPKIMRPLYNIHLLLAAMPAVIKKYADTKLILSEYQADSVYKGQIIEQIQNLGLQQQVIFAGYIPHDEMPFYYSLADLVVNIPASDGLPQSLLEAMSCGTPVVLGNLPQYDFIVEHKKNAYLVDFSPEAIAEGLIALLGDTGLRESISLSGIEYVQNQMSMEKEVKRVEDLYYSLIENKKPQQQLHFVLLAKILLYGFHRKIFAR